MSNRGQEDCVAELAMSVQIAMQGTVKADGTLDLNEWLSRRRPFRVGKSAPVFEQRSELMNVNSTVVQGTLKDDGTLELDEKPALAPGRVQVTILPMPAPAVAQARRTILDVLDEIHASQDARGYRGRSIEEMEADEAERRAEEEEYEERWRTIWRQTTSTPPSRGTEG